MHTSAVIPNLVPFCVFSTSVLILPMFPDVYELATENET